MSLIGVRKIPILSGSKSLFTRVQALFQGGARAGVMHDFSRVLYEERVSPTTVTVPDAVIGYVPDHSGNNNNSVAPFDSARSILRESMGLRYAESDAVDDYLPQTSPTHHTGAFSVWTAIASNQDTTAYTAYAGKYSDNWDVAFNGGGLYGVLRGSSQITAANVLIPQVSDFTPLVIGWEFSTTSIKAWAGNTNHTTNGTWAAGADGGSLSSLFARGSGSNVGQWHIAGHVEIAGTSTDEESLLIREWLASLNGASL